jgi:hypothetical protein
MTKAFSDGKPALAVQLIQPKGGVAMTWPHPLYSHGRTSRIIGSWAAHARPRTCPHRWRTGGQGWAGGAGLEPVGPSAGKRASTRQRGATPKTRRPWSGSVMARCQRFRPRAHARNGRFQVGAFAMRVIMSIAGHVSRAMLSRYTYVRMEAKRRALNEIAARQNAADEKRKEQAQRRQQVAVISELALVQ